MKKLAILLSALTIGFFNANAQCSPDANNFEMKLVNSNDHTLKVQVRYNDGAVHGAVSTTPTKSLGLDGLIFAIASPATSDVKLGKVISTTAPFAIVQDNFTVGAQNKTSNDNIATFYQDNVTNVMPIALGQDWVSGQWYDVATIAYTGNLSKDDFFSFVNCEYGIAHPNSYSGNSTTDPWLALMDNAGNYQQYSPKMTTEVPGNISTVSSFNIFPNPTTNEFTIEINTELNTQVGIQLLDVTGKTVKNEVSEVTKGTNRKTMNVSEITPGNYTIKITDGKTLNYIQKVQKN